MGFFVLAELIALLKRLGLNEYESRVYSSLNQSSESTASEISRKAGIPRARVYDVLMSLEKKGFVMVSVGRPVSFKAVQPEKALVNYEKQKRNSFERELNEMCSLKEELKKKFNSKTEENNSFSGVWSVSSNQINNIIADSLKNAKESIIISTSEENALKKINAFSSKLKALKSKGVEVKFALNSFDKDSLHKKLREFNAVKSKAKARFIVFDRQKVLLFLNEKKEDNEKAIFIESPFIADYLSDLI